MGFASFVVLDFIKRKTYGIKRERKFLIWFLQSNNSQQKLLTMHKIVHLKLWQFFLSFYNFLKQNGVLFVLV